MNPLAKKLTSYALGYAKVGWKVLPLHSVVDGQCSCRSEDCKSPGKHPRIKNWREQATSSEKNVFDWWQTWPESNIGIATGHASGLVVLDVDPRHGGDKSLVELQREFGDFPETIVSNTGGGGLHIFFKSPATTLSNKTNIRPGLDFRGDGGYIVAPPGTHISGKFYQWEGDPNERSLVDIPDWLMQQMADIPKVHQLPLQKTSSAVGEGGRNDYLARKAGALRRANLSPTELEAALYVVNREQCQPPLPESEVKQVAKSIAGYGNTDEQKITWPEVPKPLPSIDTQVPSLSSKMIPEILRSWIIDVAERMHVVPEFVAAPAIVSMAAVVGRKIGIFPRKSDNWFVVPNLWGAVVARPGSLKSPTIAEAMRPLDRLAKKASEKYQAEKNEMESREMSLAMELESKRDELKKSFKLARCAVYA